MSGNKKSSGAKVRAKNPENTASGDQRSPNMSNEQYQEKNSGTGHSHLAGDPVPNPNIGDDELFYSKGNSFIIMGRDRPRGLMSGYGSRRGVGNCSAIDIIADMSGIQAREVQKPTPMSKMLEPVYTDKNPQLDAARIYISQRTDIDHATDGFGVVKGSIGSPVGKSGIAIKADAIRIISRDSGIKLVTGPDIYDSNGVPIRTTGGIDLIGGNDDTYLQPMVKGDNLVDCLDEILDRISEIGKITELLSKWVLDIHTKFGTHTHAVAKGTLALPSDQALMSIMGGEMLRITGYQVSQIWNTEALRAEKLTPAGGESGYILSFKNHAN